MTGRKSKRELESALESLTSPQSTRPDERLENRCLEPVVRAVRSLVLDLIRCRQEIAAGGDDTTERFLERVRAEYGIDRDRDDMVARGLEDVAPGVKSWDAADSFATGVIGLPGRVDVSSADGESLQDLVVAGRIDDAERLLVATTYELFGDRGDRGLEVAA